MNNEEMRKMWEAAASKSDQSIRNWLENEKHKKFGGGADGLIRRHLKDGSYDPKPKTDSPVMGGPKKETRDSSLRARDVRQKASEDRKRNGQ